MLLKIQEALVVEGKYDKIRLESLVDALILETDGFRIFKDKGQLALLRRLAEERGLLILTDSDSAGFVIRNYLSGVIPSGSIKHAYIPELAGKEKRKTVPSKEGLLGVEGMDAETLKKALLRAGATLEEAGQAKGRTAFLDKTRLYTDHLSGGEGSAQRRRRFLQLADLPQHLSANRLVEVVNATMTEEEYCRLLRSL